MPENVHPKLTLYHPVKYRIRVQGQLDADWADWVGAAQVETGGEEAPVQVTTLICVVDQAGLIGLLRRLYSIGLPILSVTALVEGGIVL